MTHATEDLRISSIEPVITPAELHAEFPVSERVASTVFGARRAVHDILQGTDDRLLVVVGPCSIHDRVAAIEYAQRLAALDRELGDRLLLMMRVYFEKPRTTVGWKGLINDPDLDGSFNINKGLRLARELLLEIGELGLAAGTEYLDIVTPQYFTDLISWGAIGARTTESQVHRELASGLSCPVGFKNGTDGNLRIAVDAVRAARHAHCFLSMTMAAHSAIFTTAGNRDCHVILRGGRETNYDTASVEAAARLLAEHGLPDTVVGGWSHGNTPQQPERHTEHAQAQDKHALTDEVIAGRATIKALGLEGYIRQRWDRARDRKTTKVYTTP